MSHLVVINLGSGDLQSGCATVTAQVSNRTERQYPTQYLGSLPPAPDLERLYHRWQLLYREFYRQQSSLGETATRAITISTSGITHFSEVEFSDLAQELRQRLNDWLNAESFHTIDRKLNRWFDPTDAIQVIIQTHDPVLRRLPWHLWNFFEDFPQAEVALSMAEYERVAAPSRSTGPIRILAVLGNSHQLNLERDREAIAALPNTESVFLVEPSYQQLHEHLWDQQGWDILFFAGHSQTEIRSEVETGRLYLNSSSVNLGSLNPGSLNPDSPSPGSLNPDSLNPDSPSPGSLNPDSPNPDSRNPSNSLTLDQLRQALKRAIRQGLKLAIFNSCDGLGLAQALADLQIPQVIVMRELVPDLAAQTFFQAFLHQFAAGQSLYTAVREAREQLEKLEDRYPCVTWLPLICQNPAEEPMRWRHLPTVSQPRRNLRWPLVFASLLATVGILGLRYLGGLQAMELRAFDQLMRLRPAEPPDPRLLLITITEQDVQQQDDAERRGASLSDQSLAQLLSKLRPHQPLVVGLDLYRDFPIDPASGLTSELQQTPQFVAVCEVGESGGTKPLQSIPSQRLSFSDLPIDLDAVVRRQILGMAAAPTSACVTDTSFSLRLAQLYLAQQGIQTTRDATGTLQIGAVRFPKLHSDSGGYHQLDALGYQIMLNYRSAASPAQQVTLGQLLSGALDAQLADLVRDRIVIIGTVAPSFKDYFFTPYSQSDPMQKSPGVLIHAQMTSQILSTVLDQRPLLSSLPSWAETVWIGGWALLGGGLVLACPSPVKLGLSSVAAAGTLVGLSYVCLLQGLWLPLVPALGGLVLASGAVTIYRFWPSR